MKMAQPISHIKLLCLTLAAALMLAVAWPTDIQAAPENNAVKKPSSQNTAATKGSASKSGSKNTKKSSSTNAKKAALPWPQNLTALAKDGAVLVMDYHAPAGQSKELYSLNAEKSYVPASILKVVTTGAALEFLGPDYRFKTDFLLTRDKDLWIIGFGDPHLVSEELTLIVKALQKRGLKEVKDIYIDGSYFEKDIILDGNTQTMSPYDAYNIAFGVNFNTVSFKKNKQGQVLRASANIPLTPLAKEKAAQVKEAGTFRLNIHENPSLAELHAGQLFRAHLEEAGVKVNGEILTGQTAPKKRKVFYRHESTMTLKESLALLMKHSNNFMTNQIFLAMGAELYGAPASLSKSQLAMDVYFQRHELSPIIMGDGSGLSRSTTLTARQMADVLKVVEPAKTLFTSRDDGKVWCKTGSMSDIKTLAGYLERPNEPDKPLSFVIMLNGKGYTGETRDKILDILKARFLPEDKGQKAASAGS